MTRALEASIRSSSGLRREFGWGESPRRAGVNQSHIRRVLDDRRGHRAPARRFRDELEDYMSEDYADQTLKALTSWRRYGRPSPTTTPRTSSAWRTPSRP